VVAHFKKVPEDCIDDERQFQPATPQKQFSGDSSFRLSWSRPFTEFSGDIYATVARIAKVISPVNSANISTSDRMDEINFQNPILFGFGVPRLGLLTSGGLRPPKGATPSECTLSIGTNSLH